MAARFACRVGIRSSSELATLFTLSTICCAAQTLHSATAWSSRSLATFQTRSSTW